MKLLIVAVCACLLTACAATSTAKPDYRHATVEVINVAQTQTQ